MRKFALIAALVLVSATAWAGESRNLTLAAGDETATAAQPAAKATPADAPKTADATAPAETTAETPKYVERPAAVSPTADAPKADIATKPVVAQGPKADKPKHKRYWNEARIIGELHRHGIYW